MGMGTCEHVQWPEECVDCSCLSPPPFSFNVGSLPEPRTPIFLKYDGNHLTSQILLSGPLGAGVVGSCNVPRLL